MTAIPAEIRAEIEKLERKHGENPEGRYFVPLANAYRRSGSMGDAISVLRKGIRRHPDYLSARIVLGHCYADQGDVDSARSEYQHVLSFDPHNLVALRSLGELAAAAGNDDEARRRYEQLLAVDPMNEEARVGLQMLSHGSSLAGFARAAEMEADEDDAPGGGDVIPDFPRTEVPEPAEVTVAATTGGLSAPEFQAPSGEREDAEGVAPGGDVDYDGEEIVVTETIAELYTRQGFFTRAAHVYRELLRRHGEDARLRDRLNRVERLALGGDSLAGTAAETPSAPADEVGQGGPSLTPPAQSSSIAPAESDASEDPFADSFAAGFPRVEISDVEIVATGGVVRGSTDIDPSAEGPPVAEASGPVAASTASPESLSPEPGRIGDYLLGVLDWSGASRFGRTSRIRPPPSVPASRSAHRSPPPRLPWKASRR